MRLLLTLLLMVPAFAQQPDQQTKPDEKAAQTPVKTDDKSQAPAKPDDQAQTPAKADEKAAASPAPTTEQWLAGSVDFGYRWLTDIRGNFPEYRSVVNLGEGPKLTGLDFTITDPKKRLFDRVDANAYGWGGDPYNSAHLRARKQGDYEFTFDYRNLAYFNAEPTYANPQQPAGFDQQSFDMHRRTMSIGLDLRPGKRITPYLVFERNSGYGNGVDHWVQDSNDEFAVPTLLRDSTNNYRGGVRFEFNRFHVTLEQGGTTFKDDDQTNWSGTNFGNNTTPIFGQTLVLNTLKQAYGIRGNSIYSKALMTAHPFSWIDIYGQFLFSEPQTTVNFTEGATGNFALLSQLLFYSSQQTIGTGSANQPHTTGSVGFELRPLKRVRIIESWMTDRFHDAGSILYLPSIPANVITLAGTTPPLPSPASPLEVVNYNQTETNIFVDVTSKLTLRGGYRYVWGDVSVPTSPFSQTGPTESGQLKRNIALAGLNFRATQKMSFNLDYEGGTSDGIYFRTSLNNYQKARMRAKYQLTQSLSLQANVQVLNNFNHAPSIQFDMLSRNNSVTVFWAPASGKFVTFTGEYSRSTFRSNINYLGLFLQPAVSNYRDNAHTITSAADLTVPGKVAAKLTLGGSFFLSNGTRNTNYYQPLARLSLPVGKHLFWNTEWQYYGLREDFYLFEGFRTHMFMTGLKVVR